jgi:predicted Zn-dependent protease
MYTRDEAKAITDKVMNMATADAVEVELTGGERSGTRWANSSITTNLVQYDREVTVNVRLGQKSGSASTRDFSDAGLKTMVDEAISEARQARDNANLPELLGPQQYIPVDAALPGLVNFGPAERARMVRDSIDIAERKGVLGAGYIPKVDQTSVTANSKGLFSYYRVAEAGFVLTCRMPNGSGSGWAGTTGIKDVSMIDAKALTEVASDKALKSQNAKAIEPGRYTVILEPRANARFLSLMTGLFNTPIGAGESAGGRGGREGAPPEGQQGGRGSWVEIRIQYSPNPRACIAEGAFGGKSPPDTPSDRI